MGKFVIANPPIGIYKNQDITIGQAFYLVHLDVQARVRSELLGKDISFPTYSFNIYGKRGDTLKNPQEYSDEYRAKKSLRERLDLSSNEVLSEDEPDIIGGVKGDFVNLFEKGFIFFEGKKAYLNLGKIKKSFSLEDHIENISLTERTKATLERYWENNMSVPHAVTKSTKFSIPNPFGGKQNLSPLFTLANLWEHKYGDSSFFMAGSERNLTNYIYLRGICQMALRDSFGSDYIFVYPQLKFSEGKDEWNLDTLTREKYGSDFLRYALLTPSLKGGGIANIDKSKLKAARKFVYSLGNLNKILDYSPPKSNPLEERFIKDFLSFNIPQRIFSLGSDLRDLSNKVRISKLEGSFENEKESFSIEYSQIAQLAKIITPKIFKSIQK